MIKKLTIFLLVFATFNQAQAKDALSKSNLSSSTQNSRSQTMKRIHPPSFFPLPIEMILPMPLPQVKVPANEQAIQIKKLEIKVQVTGLESETSTLITFYNPNGRVLEGELEFPLQNDASVVGYALDVNGKMVDGVIVSKEKARVVLETEIRKGVDPGIVEHVKGNFFRTRLYPIPALGERSIRITSVAPLSLFKEDAAMHIPLPLGIAIPSLSIEVQVNNPNVKPEIGGFGNLTFTNWKNNFTAQTKMSNVTPDNDLFINLPKIPARKVSVEKFGDEVFVAVSELPNYDQGSKIEVPKKLNIFWDASGSRKPDSVRKDREFLVALFKEWRELHIQVIVFRNEVGAPVDFEVQAGQANKFFAFLESLAYDGATNLSKLDFHKIDNSTSNLLFTDGLATLGDRPTKFGGAPINVVSSDTSRDGP